MKENKKIKKLEEEILRHKILYYRGIPAISDERYDHLEDQLKKMDPENPILKLVGAPIDNSTGKIRHETKMLSLEKTYDLGDLKKWLGKYQSISIEKMDGSSSSLVYRKGYLSIAKTRGDGEWGENIKAKCLFISDIPKSIDLDEEVEIRGEIYCSEKNFTHLCLEMKKKELPPPTSLRNIVAGILGRKEHIDIASFLEFKAFDILFKQNPLKSELEKLKKLESLGFKIPIYQFHENAQTVDESIDEIKKKMEKSEYLIDGVVFVLNDLRVQEELGFTGHHPKFKMAFKFKGESKNSKICEITWQVSRNGILTPVAEIEPIYLSGAEVSRVTLHNFGVVQSFNLKKEDVIEVVRSGEVIPKFLGVVESSRSNFSYPEKCPSCHGKLQIEDIWLFCENSLCPAKKLEEILHFMRVIGIEDISEKRLAEMINSKLVKDIPDLYRLTSGDFLSLEKVKEKLSQKMLENIQKTKAPKLPIFISALGIEGVSVTKCEKIIMNGFDSLLKMQSMTVDDLMKIDSFAEKSAHDFISGLKQKKKLIDELMKIGFKVLSDSVVKKDLLNKGKFCITGELSVKRTEIENLIKQFGGLIVSSVTKNTDFLLTNETDSQSSKFLKAKELKVPIISENDFFKKIGK